MYLNVNNPVNYQLQGFGQNGVRTISTDQLYIQGEYYRVLVAEEDSYVTAVSVLGDDLTAEFVYAGTTIYGLFTEVSVTSGSLTAYIAGPTDIEDVWAYINAYGEANAATIEAADCAKDAIAPLLDKYYAKASLVMVPSLYKTSIVYSERPLTTDGQLAFARSNDTATRVGPDGYIEKVRTNLLTYSQDFSNAAYNKGTGGSVSANTVVAPDGTTTADAYTFASSTSTFAYLSNQASSTSTLPHTFSIYIKRPTGSGSRTLRLVISDVTTTTGISSNFTITESWQRFEFTRTSGSSTGFVGIGFALASSGVSIAAGEVLDIWGAQLETGDIATDYIPTTTVAVSVGPVANLPRLNYPINSDGSVGCPSLLLEPQTTALNQFSEQLNNAYWGLARTSAFGSGSVANAVTSPDGTQSAEYVQQAVGQTTGGGAFVAVLNSTGNHTISVFAKMAEQRYLRLGGALGAGGVGLFCNFDLQDGVAGTPSAGVTPKIDNYGNGWYRCSITASKVDLTGNSAFFYQANTLNGPDATPLSGLYLWGANVTQTAYATSYIPTLGASVTRGADSCIKTGISSLIGQTQGTVMVEYNQSLIGQSATRRIFALSDGTTSNRITAYVSSSNGIDFYVRNSGGDLFLGTAASPIGNTKGVHKIAAAYKNGDYAVYLDGVQIISGAGTAGTLPTCSRFDLGNQLGSNDLYEPMMQALLFKTRLTNQELQDLTTL
jgi:hypothetical protein